MGKNQVELLSPAGNMDAFFGAIHAGADAVYLGGSKYGARAYADNFTTEELIFCIRYAHIFGRKVYLTVNTLMKDCEIEELYDYISPLYEAGLDACIVQDFGAFQYLKQCFPDMELHASTQMTITGAGGAGFLKEIGATRIVPARELSLFEIKHMKEETGLEIETFIHGAMCYCYSGQCLFSSILGGRSGNRGRCAQPCRLPYDTLINNTDCVSKNNKKNHHQLNEEQYPLSLKDMCTLEHIEALMEAGIDSFKIEGRMKKPEYSAGVTSIYRKYIDLKLKNPEKPLVFQKNDLETLSKLYIRSERQEGYYFKQNGADMVTITNPAYSGSDDTLLEIIRNKFIETKPKLQIQIYATMVLSEKVSLTLICGENSVSVNGDVAEEAKNMPLTTQSIEKQLLKLGDTCFEAVQTEVYTDEKCFYPVKSLNELRRQAITLLENQIIESYGLCPGRKQAYSSRESKKSSFNTCGIQHENSIPEQENDEKYWTVSLTTKEQLTALSKACSFSEILPIKRIYIESQLLTSLSNSITENNYLSMLEHIKSKLIDVSLYISLPYVMRLKDEKKLHKLLDVNTTLPSKGLFKGVLIRTLEEYVFLKKIGYMSEIRGDAGIYIWNKEALHFWNNRLDGIHCPIELNKKEWKALFNGEHFEKLVYGRIPMMITANCIAKTTTGCLQGKESSVSYLKDRYQKQFPVNIVCEYCMNILYNSVPLSLHKDVALSLDEYDKKLMFTVENENETMSILNFFLKIHKGQLTEPPFKDYTTGHEKRGVL